MFTLVPVSCNRRTSFDGGCELQSAGSAVIIAAYLWVSSVLDGVAKQVLRCLYFESRNLRNYYVDQGLSIVV